MNTCRKQKSFSLLLLLSVLPLIASAQKVSYDNVKLEFTQMPLHPLSDDIESYRADLLIDIPEEMGDADKLNRQYLKISGLQKAEEGVDLMINLTLGDFKVVDKELLSDKVFDLNSKANRTGYCYDIHCSYPAVLTVNRPGGNELLNIHIKPEKESLNFIFGKWEYAKGDLESKYESEKKELLFEVQEKYVEAVMRETRDILDSNYGYPEKRDKVKIAMGKGRKYDYQDLENAFLHAEKAFEGITDKDETGLVNQEFTAAIQLWKKAIAESDGKAKSRISYDIKMMMLYNCALAHMWMNDFEQARVELEAANAMITDKTKGSEIRQLEELAEAISDKEQRFLANQ